MKTIKKRFCLIGCMLFVAMASSMAQTTGLYTYKGGYFIKNGDSWSEYRPADKEGVWATYTQYNEEENYFNIKSSQTTLSIPKTTNHAFYIVKDKEWVKIYETREIYDYFQDPGRQIYCYKGGYFVRNGNSWTEYRPGDKKGVWATYTQYNEDDNYYQMQSSSCNVSVPKKTVHDFYIHRNDTWEKCYVSTDIYDANESYDFVIHYKYHRVANSQGKLEDFKEVPASMNISRKGKVLLRCGNKSYSCNINYMEIMYLKDSDRVLGFQMSIDEENYIFVMDGWTMINIKKVCPFMNFNEETNSETIDKIKELIRNKSFFQN